MLILIMLAEHWRTWEKWKLIKIMDWVNRLIEVQENRHFSERRNLDHVKLFIKMLMDFKVQNFTTRFQYDTSCITAMLWRVIMQTTGKKDFVAICMKKKNPYTQGPPERWTGEKGQLRNYQNISFFLIMLTFYYCTLWFK